MLWQDGLMLALTRAAAVCACTALAITGCGGGGAARPHKPAARLHKPATTTTALVSPGSLVAPQLSITGPWRPASYVVPPLLDPHDVYAADRRGRLSPTVRHFRALVYVPNSASDTVDEIDPHTDRIVRQFSVGAVPQHVVPAYDLRTLWVTNDIGNSLTPIDAANGIPGRPVHVEDPYNMYFTPDGRYAMVMAEQLRRIDFRDAHTMKLYVSNRSAGTVSVVSFARRRVIATWRIPGGSPDMGGVSASGRVLWLSGRYDAAVYAIATRTGKLIRRIQVGLGPHGVCVWPQPGRYSLGHTGVLR